MFKPTSHYYEGATKSNPSCFQCWCSTDPYRTKGMSVEHGFKAPSFEEPVWDRCFSASTPSYKSSKKPPKLLTVPIQHPSWNQVTLARTRTTGICFIQCEDPWAFGALNTSTNITNGQRTLLEAAREYKHRIPVNERKRSYCIKGS